MDFSGGGKPTVCAVCMEEYEFNDQDREPKKLSGCGHTFCHRCIERIGQTTKKCPECRRDFTTAQPVDRTVRDLICMVQIAERQARESASMRPPVASAEPLSQSASTTAGVKRVSDLDIDYLARSGRTGARLYQMAAHLDMPEGTALHLFDTCRGAENQWRQLLIQWRDRHKDGATITAYVEALVNGHCRDTAERVVKHFRLPATTRVKPLLQPSRMSADDTITDRVIVYCVKSLLLPFSRFPAHLGIEKTVFEKAVRCSYDNKDTKWYFLEKWRTIKKREATVGALARACRAMGQNDDAERIELFCGIPPQTQNTREEQTAGSHPPAAFGARRGLEHISPHSRVTQRPFVISEPRVPGVNSEVLGCHMAIIVTHCIYGDESMRALASALGLGSDFFSDIESRQESTQNRWMHFLIEWVQRQAWEATFAKLIGAMQVIGESPTAAKLQEYATTGRIEIAVSSSVSSLLSQRDGIDKTEIISDLQIDHFAYHCFTGEESRLALTPRLGLNLVVALDIDLSTKGEAEKWDDLMTKWKKLKREDATLGRLEKALRECGYNCAADSVHAVIVSKQ